MQLNIGKIRGLAATSSEAGAFTILAFDHRQSFVKMLNPAAPEKVPYGDVVAAKTDVVHALAPHASAVLLDPIYSAAQTISNRALPGKTGLLVAIEETGYTGKSTARVSTILPSWSVAKIKLMRADAVKLLLYYHPHSGELAKRQEQLALEVIEACRETDILLFLEPISYSIDPGVNKKSSEFAEERPQLITEIARRLGALGPDVLKLEFPVDSNFHTDEALWMKACELVSQASPCPWAVLSAGVSFEMFVQQVEVACCSGASGYIAGRAVWKEGIPMPASERMKWLKRVAVNRLETLAEIAGNFARPWTDFYAPLDTSAFDGWYSSYGE